METGNLLVSLERWASRQQENFLTDAFAALLRLMLLREPTVAAAVVRRITGDRLSLSTEAASAVTVETQVRIPRGCVDLVIEAIGHTAFVEVKRDSGLGPRQLERYRLALEAQEAPAKTLVVLSKHRLGSDDGVGAEDVACLWHEVEDTLSSILPQAQDDVARFEIERFVEYLHMKGLAVERVPWEMPAGIQGLRSLIRMVEEAATSLGESIKKSSGDDWQGRWIGDKKFWVGIYLDEPDRLWFQTEELEIDAERLKSLGTGDVRDNAALPGGMQWRNSLLLSSEETHFFALSRPSQLRAVEEFLRESRDAVLGQAAKEA